MARQAGWQGTSSPYLGGRLGPALARSPRLLQVLLLGAVLPLAAAQNQLILANSGEKLPSFEVAAIRSDNSGPYHTSVMQNGDSYRAENLTLRDLISRGWGTRTRGQIEGGPDNLMDRRFDVTARIAADDLTRLNRLPDLERQRQLAFMVQTLLADRFDLAVHVRTRKMPIYALVVAKGGPRFHVSASSVASEVRSGSAGNPTPHGDGTWMHSDGKHYELTAYASSMDGLAGSLSNVPETTGRYVINKTGLSGSYDYTLQWTPEYLRAGGSPEAHSDTDPVPAGPSLFTALQDQLGLKLVPEKAPLQELVIDHVEPPSSN